MLISARREAGRDVQDELESLLPRLASLALLASLAQPGRKPPGPKALLAQSFP